MHPAWYGDATFMPHLWTILGNRRSTADVYILPEGTLRIGSRAFSGLKKQGVRIFLPTSIVEIADDAFADSDVTAVLAGSAYVYDYCDEHNIPTESAYDWGGDG